MLGPHLKKSVPRTGTFATTNYLFTYDDVLEPTQNVFWEPDSDLISWSRYLIIEIAHIYRGNLLSNSLIQGANNNCELLQKHHRTFLYVLILQFIQ